CAHRDAALLRRRNGFLRQQPGHRFPRAQQRDLAVCRHRGNTARLVRRDRFGRRARDDALQEHRGAGIACQCGPLETRRERDVKRVHETQQGPDGPLSWVSRNGPAPIYQSATISVAVVPVAFSRATRTGRTLPAGTFRKMTVWPPARRAATSPVWPTKSARGRTAMSTASLGTIAAASRAGAVRLVG